MAGEARHGTARRGLARRGKAWQAGEVLQSRSAFKAVVLAAHILTAEEIHHGNITKTDKS